MDLNIILIIATVAFFDIAGRVAALAFLMKNGEVNRLKYKTWVLLCIFLNFAWVFYFILGRPSKTE